ncbi:SelB domain-containing protein [Streptomyces cacaoi]|uniref:SelB domain-containing protein n=1 Tax=Streptomyces cacaoi TaxID=1898 RepID=UPI0037481436
MHVLATAGHVDHGKSTLVRALTGMEPDRWAEERRRGLTLDLGFGWTRLAPEQPPVAFVDVPGHERFVHNMLAGVGPVPGVLFVVAADQGWQAQSSEHLAVLDALGVRHGLLAVTRSDLAAPHTLRATREEALAHLRRSSLGEVPSVTVSATAGTGTGALRAALARLVAALPAPDPAADVRLWVDRSFTVRGHGTVVTGTLAGGTLRTGDRLLLTRGEAPVRVRQLQSLNEERREVGGLARVAVNLHGPAAGTARRGDALLTPDRWLLTDTLDVRLRGADAPPDDGLPGRPPEARAHKSAREPSREPSRALPRELVLHTGSAAVPARVRPLGGDTARLRLARALPLRIGDRAVLRDPGRYRDPVGVTVLDVRPPPLRRRGAAAARARELTGLTGVPDGADELRRRLLVHRAELVAMGAAPPAPPVAGEWLADPGHWRRLRARLVEAVEQHATAHPLAPGLPTGAARHALDLPDRALVDALARAPGPRLENRDGRLYGTVGRPALPDRLRTAVDAVRRELAAAPYRAPDAGRLRALGLDRSALAAAEAAGALLKVADGIVLLPGADEAAAALLARLPQPFTASQARQALGTTRRVTVPLLEHLDRTGRTVRLDPALRRCPGSAD